MMWARFPNGQVVQYNNANWLAYKTGVWELYSKDPAKGGTWICSIPHSAGCIIEAVKACSVENPIAAMTVDHAYNMLMENIKQLSGWQAKELKTKMAEFNKKTHSWQN